VLATFNNTRTSPVTGYLPPDICSSNTTIAGIYPLVRIAVKRERESYIIIMMMIRRRRKKEEYI